MVVKTLVHKVSFINRLGNYWCHHLAVFVWGLDDDVQDLVVLAVVGSFW